MTLLNRLIFSVGGVTSGRVCAWPVKHFVKGIYIGDIGLILLVHLINTLPLNRRKVSLPVEIRYLLFNPLSLQQVSAVIENGLFNRLAGKVSCKKGRTVAVFFFFLEDAAV